MLFHLCLSQVITVLLLPLPSFLALCLFVCLLSIYLSVSLSFSLFCYLSVTNLRTVFLLLISLPVIILDWFTSLWNRIFWLEYCNRMLVWYHGFLIRVRGSHTVGWIFHLDAFTYVISKHLGWLYSIWKKSFIIRNFCLYILVSIMSRLCYIMWLCFNKKWKQVAKTLWKVYVTWTILKKFLIG